MPYYKSRPINRKMKNVSRSMSEPGFRPGRDSETSFDLGINRHRQSQIQKRRRSSLCHQIIRFRGILQESQYYKVLFENIIIPDSGDDDNVYIDFLEMIGGFEARKRIMREGPFSSRPKPRDSQPNREFPELASLLKNLPKNRYSRQTSPRAPSPKSAKMSEHLSEFGAQNVVFELHKSDESHASFEIEDYPVTHPKSECEEDIVDLTAGIDLLAIPKSMSSMAESMYS